MKYTCQSYCGWTKNCPTRKAMIDVTRILLAGLKIESGIHEGWRFVRLPTSLYLQHPTPANMGCVTERFFAWWKFYVTFCSCGFATPTVTVDGVMWHAAPGREYLTIIWTLLLHPFAQYELLTPRCKSYSVLLSFTHFSLDEKILRQGLMIDFAKQINDES